MGWCLLRVEELEKISSCKQHSSMGNGLSTQRLLQSMKNQAALQSSSLGPVLGVVWGLYNSVLPSLGDFDLSTLLLSSVCFLSSTAAAAAKSLQSCPTLCDPIDSSPPDSPIPGILQARPLEWVAISFSKAWKWKVKVKSLSCVRLLATPWTAAYQDPPSMGFSWQEYWWTLIINAWLQVSACASANLE